MMPKITLMVLVAFLFGSVECLQAQPNSFNRRKDKDVSQSSPSKKRTVTVEVITEPPGAAIEIDGGYVGFSPCTIDIESSRSGKFKKVTVIKALPREAGQYSQSKVFKGASFPEAQEDYIPKKIYFNMHLGPVGDKVDVTINQTIEKKE
jgi:hypothetical protein